MTPNIDEAAEREAFIERYGDKPTEGFTPYSHISWEGRFDVWMARARLAAEREAELRRDAERVAVWLDREAWSFLRNVLGQGMAIEMDYRNGKYETYEHLSARLDAAARERCDELDVAITQEPRT